MTTTATNETTLAKYEDIERLAAQIKDNWSLCQLFEGTHAAFEAEMMVAQTFHAVPLNMAEHGKPFSFKGDRVHSRDGNGLVDNGSAYAMLLERGYFVEDEHTGRPTIVITDRLVKLIDGHFAKGLTP